MRRTLYFVMALALVLGLSQCKKEQPATPQNGQVRITLNVNNGGNNGSRVNVNPATSPMVTFEKGDKILVGYNGAYVGTLTHNGSQFEGSINATQNGDLPLYFYFVGNKQGTLEAGTTSCTVNISDQTAELPVLSFAPSEENFTGGGSYSASLHNQCALVKFPLTNAAGSVCVSGMCTEATISFASPSITKTGVTGTVRLHSVSDTEKWAILLPQNEIATNVVIGGTEIPVTVPEIIANRYVTSIDEIDNSSVSSLVDLSKLYDHYTAKDGDILTGTLRDDFQISIADGATVTLDGVSINAEGDWDSYWAGITCEGNATIILKDGTINTVRGFSVYYPGIYVPVGSTLTIKGGAAGTGKLTASSNGSGAGIGGGYDDEEDYEISCGNIEIKGGYITANGGFGAAGIGSGGSSCGTITISGGTVTATGGDYAAGIGSGSYASCGTITITNGVTQVTAKKGEGAPNSIGAGEEGTCGTVTIGGVVYPSGATPNQSDGLTFVYPVPAPAVPTGAINSIFNVGTSASPKYVYFSEGNLQYSQSADKWSFMEHQYDMEETSGMNVGTNYADQDIVSLFGWGTGNNPTKTGGGAAEYENYTEWGTNTIYSGTTATTNWRTLTRDEWDNLFANHQYGYVMISNGSQWICGAAIDPSSTTTLNTDHSHWSDNLYLTGLDAFIADAEAGGWLFLPAAGLRSGTNVTKVSDPSSGAGYYWSSTKEYDSLLEFYQSNYLWIKSNQDAMINRNPGSCGHSVRLVKDAE